ARLIVLGRGRVGVLVGIVAGDAAEGSAAFGVATAEGPAGALGADPAGVTQVVRAEVPAEDVAVVALLGRDGRGRSRGGCDDGRIGETGRDGRHVVAPRPVTPLAADGTVGRLGTYRLRSRPWIRRMAIQALGHAVTHPDGFALEGRGLTPGWMELGEGGSIPTAALGRVVIRQPRDVVFGLRIAVDHGQVSVAGPERICDHGFVDFPPDPRLFPQYAVALDDRMGDLGVVG